MTHVSRCSLSAWLTSSCRRASLLALLVCLWFGSALFAHAQETKPVRDPAEVRARLNRILANPEYQPVVRQENALTRFFKWLGDQWDAFWKNLRKALHLDEERPGRHLPTSPAAAGLMTVFTWLFVIGGLVLLAYLIRGAVLRYLDARDNRQSKKKSVFDIDSADADMVKEPDVWVQEAQKFANASDYRRAIRALFLAILLQLDQAGAIEYQRFRTNGEYLRLLRSKGYDALVHAFRPFVLDFEIRWYGDRVTAENDYRNCLTEYQRLRDMILGAGKSATTPTAASPGRA